MTSFAEKLGLFSAEVVTARSGAPTLRFGEKHLLSPYDPGREAARRAMALPAGRIHLVGLGLGYLAEALGDRIERLLLFSGEEERLQSARGIEPEAILPRERIPVAQDESDCRAFLDQALAANAPLLLDPSLAAVPRFRARLLDYKADFDVERGTSAGSLTEETATATCPDLELLLRHQKRHEFIGYPPFDFEFMAAPSLPKRILVIQPSSIGDVLYFTPALRGLHALHSEARITYLVEQEAAEVVRGQADHLLVARRTDWIDEDAGAHESLARLAAAIEREGFDLVVNPHSSARCAWYATLAARQGAIVLGTWFRDGCPIVSGNIHHLRWIHAIRDQITLHPAPKRFVFPHGFSPRLTVAGEMARRTGLGFCDPRTSFALGARRRAQASDWLNTRGALDAPRLVAVHTGSNAPVRRYRRDRWPAVCDGLARELDARVLLIGGPADVERNSWIRARCATPPLDATAAGGLGFTVAILERCALLVGPETSTAHLAAAAGCPTLTVTGRVETGWSGAFAARSLVLHGPADPPWCRLLEPETIVRQAAFVLEDADGGPLPAGFGRSWTGQRAPNEFFRESYPERRFTIEEYRDHLLAIAWENLLTIVNESHGYPSAVVDATMARAWLGPPPVGAAVLLRDDIEALDDPGAFGGAFHAPLEYLRTAKESEQVIARLKAFLEEAIHFPA
jgi:ADP-heptose:LPS heptosyltransferase